VTAPLSNERLAQLITECAVTATMLNQHDLLAALCELVERRQAQPPQSPDASRSTDTA
jgi:hypothetical protein